MLIELIKISLESIIKNKMRSFLTMLGIIIGIMVIILMQAVIEGFKGNIQEDIDRLGTNSFIVSKWPAFGGGSDWKKYRKRKDITQDYINTIKKSCLSVAEVIPLMDRWGQVIKHNNKKTDPNISVHGASDGWINLAGHEISDGRYFADFDLKEGFDYAVIGNTVKNRLFSNENVIGEKIFLRGKKFIVIGVFTGKGEKFGEDQDSFITIPARSFTKLYGKKRGIELSISAKSTALISRAIDELTITLRRIRRVKVGEENDFEIITKDDLSNKLNNIIGIIYLAALSIGGMSILVGSIGIMNIMLVSVTERTKEIGIRRSIGANRQDLLTQFLLEAIFISIMGGLIGISLGIGISQIISQATGWHTQVPFWISATAFFISILIGVLSGMYPAVKASRLNPIDALRFE